MATDSPITACVHELPTTRSDANNAIVPPAVTARARHLMLRSNHLVQTVRTTFPVVQTVPFTFPLGISHLHLWRSGDGFSDSVCTAGKKMASLHKKPYIIALQLQLCTWREPSYSRIRPLPMRWSGGGVVSRKKGARSMGEAKKEGENNNNNNNNNKYKVDK